MYSLLYSYLAVSSITPVQGHYVIGREALAKYYKVIHGTIAVGTLGIVIYWSECARVR